MWFTKDRLGADGCRRKLLIVNLPAARSLGWRHRETRCPAASITSSGHYPTMTTKKLNNRRHSAPDPSVGVFWFWRGRLLADCNALATAEEFHGILNGSQDHVHVWPRFQGQFPELRGTDYIEISRGRVLYRRSSRKFTVYLDRSLATPKVKAAIVAGFGLPPSKVLFKSDPHYTVDPKILGSLFDSDN